MEKAPSGIAQLTYRFGREYPGSVDGVIEVGLAVARISIDKQPGTGSVVGHIQRNGIGADQGIVIVLG